MANSTSNLVSTGSTTSGLVKPLAFGNTNPSPSAKGFITPNPSAPAGSSPGFGGIASGISNFLGPMGGNQTTPMFASGSTTQSQNVGSFAGSNPVGILAPPGGNTQTSPNRVASSQTMVSPASNYTPSTYQQNLNKYGISSIPAGYSFDASGKLTNNAGQEYQASPTTSNINSGSAGGGGISATGNTQNQGSGTGGGGAPAGMMYDGTGNLVPNINSAQNSNQATSSTFANTAGTLAQTASQTNPAYDQAVKDYQTAQQGLQQSRTNEANQLALNSENPIPLEFQQGRGQVIQNQYLSQQNALAQQMTAAQGLGTIGTAQQGTQQSGLNQASTQLKPEVGSYGQTQYSPLGGTVGANGTTNNSTQVQPSDPFYQTLQTYANALANNQGGAIPSSITGNPALQAQLLQMAQKINPNFNYNTSQGIASGEQQSGAAGGAINAQQQQQVATYKSASQQAGNLGLQLNQLISQTGVNPSDINAVNQGIQKIAANTSDKNYATFQNLITDIANTYSQVLTPPGGSATDASRALATSMLDSSMKGSGISQVMQNLDAAVQAKISGVMTNNSPSTLNGSTNTKSNSQPSGWF